MVDIHRTYSEFYCLLPTLFLAHILPKILLALGDARALCNILFLVGQVLQIHQRLNMNRLGRKLVP